MTDQQVVQTEASSPGASPERRQLLVNCVDQAKMGGPAEDYTREQLEKMLEFTRMVTVWYSQIDRLPTPALQRLFRGGARLAKLFGITGATVGDPAETGSN